MIKLQRIDGDLIAEGENLIELIKANYANLEGANLNYANLEGANLEGANLNYANLEGANLNYANLKGANLNYVNLEGANLNYANLKGANLEGANLKGAKNAEYAFAVTMTCPPEGSFVAWKKCDGGVLVKLQIPAKAKRSCATGRKCRAEFVKVLSVVGADVGITNPWAGVHTEYRKGEIVHCDKWSEDRWTECAGGIHFFMTRIEAEQY